jgi:DNA-directed RNA polymerase specialized sigma24 family protein
MLTKKQAAAFVNCSEKTIERAVKRGELAAQYTKGANGQIVVFDQSELERYKARCDAILHAPSIVSDDEQLALVTIEPQPQTTPDTSDRQARQGDFTALVQAFADTLSLHKRSVPLSEKWTLSVQEGAELSGIAISVIKAAIKSGKLKTVPGARGAKHIRRTDLDVFIQNL